MAKDNQRRGPWSAKEKKFIADNIGDMSAEEIAAELRRNKDKVQEYIDTLANNQTSKISALEAEFNIKGSPVWADLQKQFSKEELKLFLYHWRRIISQFKDDVLPTEEFQIIDVVKLELLSNRSLSKQQEVLGMINKLQKLIDAEEARSPDTKDFAKLDKYKHDLAILYGSQESDGKEYRDLQDKKSKILKDLKATREQRIKLLESSKETVLGWIKDILSNTEKRLKLGREMEKMRLAAEKEYERLTQEHTYDDGMIDIPFLVPEEIEKRTQQEDEED